MDGICFSKMENFEDFLSQVTQAAIEAHKRAEEERRREEEKERLLREQRIEVEKEEIEENVNKLEVSFVHSHSHPALIKTLPGGY
ncbi:unnamed protein product [Gongylonema pulchrum]|uniref:TPX2 domain-containing protein n=1 Tax=Gongylonema pulchrum TaxID=637853 RepID=A0A183DLY9_9BILA|nr:unnamed protein product [Gongylonema pulchrum]